MSKSPQRNATTKRAKPATGSKRSRAADAPRVAVVGGGMGGMTAALRLAKAGYAVTLFERDAILGGNTSSRVVGGVPHDVYPHMFCAWYDNFWHLYENELGLSRAAHFEPRYGVKMLKQGEREYSTLMNPTSLDAIVKNLNSGAMSPAQLFLLSYSGLDLVAHPFDRSGLNQLQQLDVNGFLYSRGYATEPVAQMENWVLSLIWSIQSEQTAAATYQNFLRHSYKFPDHSPFAWFMKGAMSDLLVAPMAEALAAQGCQVRLKSEVTALSLSPVGLPVVSVGKAPPETFDYAVLALPGERLSALALAEPQLDDGASIVDHAPELAELQRLQSAAIPVLDLYLKVRLPDLPRDSIGLAGSNYGLTVLDISQLWSSLDPDGNTVLVLAASEGASLPSLVLEEQGWLMIAELCRFIPGFRTGKRWGDPDSDIDWRRSYVRANAQHKLYLNDVGSWAWRPRTAYPDALPRLAFAGDIVQTEVDMATVESAVMSGIQAARAIQLAEARLTGQPARGAPIHCVPHTVYSPASLRWAKLFFLPFAYGALAKAALEEVGKRRKDGDAVERDGQYLLADYLLLVPMQYTIDWWKGAYWFARSLIADESGKAREAIGPDELPDDPGQPHDREIDLPTAVLMTLGECADYAIERLLHRRPAARDDTGDAPGGFMAKAIDLMQAFAGRADEPRPHKRRWRPKR